MRTTFFSILMMLSACFLGSCNNNSKEKGDTPKAKTEVKTKKTVHPKIRKQSQWQSQLQ